MSKPKQRDRKGRTTIRGYAPLDDDDEDGAGVEHVEEIEEPTLREAPPEFQEALAELSARTGSGPGYGGVEVEYVKEHGSPQLLDGPWRAVEIWTRNRVYALDSTLVCIEVSDRETGRSDPEHKIIGSRLIGGQKRRKQGRVLEVSHPFPRAGAAAVFERRIGKRVSFSETSAVTRVVLRMRIVSLEPDERQPSWDEVTGSGQHRPV